MTAPSGNGFCTPVAGLGLQPQAPAASPVIDPQKAIMIAALVCLLLWAIIMGLTSYFHWKRIKQLQAQQESLSMYDIDSESMVSRVSTLPEYKAHLDEAEGGVAVAVAVAAAGAGADIPDYQSPTHPASNSHSDPSLLGAPSNADTAHSGGRSESSQGRPASARPPSYRST
ncbi:uncharacterized protein BJ171DRAFT_505187, partial [Polychytrium aggregatum]|uniref:uncharacterized protein n=1 Tax=Polychytrium aggregatum TaxID=110093 RepID=UPI0022FE4BBA